MSIAIMLFFLSISGMQTYYSTQKYMLSQIENSTYDRLIQASQKLDYQLTQVKNIVQYLSTDKVLSQNIDIFTNQASITDKLNAKSDIEAVLVRMQNFSPYINSIFLFGPTQSFYSGYQTIVYNITHDEIEKSIYGKVLALSSDEAILFEKNSVADDLSPLVSNFCWGSMNLTKEDPRNFSIFAVLGSEIFEEILPSQNNYIILNKHNEIVWKSEDITDDDMKNMEEQSSLWHEDTSRIYTRNSTIFRSNSKYNDWTIYYFQKDYEVKLKIAPLKSLVLITLLISIGLAILLSGIVSKKLTKPIRELTQSISECNYEQMELPKLSASKARTSLNESINYYFIGVVFIPVLFYMIISHIFIQRIVGDYVADSYYISFQQTVDNVDQHIITNEKIAKSIAYNDSVQRMLDDQVESEQKPTITEIDTIIDRLIKLSDDKSEIFICNTEKNLVYSNVYMSKLDDPQLHTMETATKHSSVIHWMPTSVDTYKRSILNLIMKINHVSDYNSIGQLYYRIPEFSLENIYKHSMSMGNTVYIVDSENRIISHPDKNKIGTDLPIDLNHNIENIVVKSPQSFYFIEPLSNSTWYLVGQFPQSLLRDEQNRLLIEKLYLLITIFMIIVFISYYFSNYFTASINYLNKQLAKIGIDNMEIEFPEDDKINEINELGVTFNNVVTRMYSLIDQLIISTKKQHDLENKKNEAELVALQAQINPHFLYNTFESINWLIKSNDLENAIQMLNSLSELLRYTAKSAEPTVSIKDEINYAKHYTEIMAMRFGNSIEFKYEIDYSLAEYKSIRLTLQPLIENAIYHGIQPKNHIGTITILCYKQNNTIILAVHDNGVGIHTDKLIEINKSLNSSLIHEHIGLHNVQNRIKLFFGEAYGVTLISEYGKGTTSEIRIPIIK